MTTDEEQVPRGAEQKTVELRSVNAKATIQIRLWFDGRSTEVIKVTVTIHTSSRWPASRSHADLFIYLSRSASMLVSNVVEQS